MQNKKFLNTSIILSVLLLVFSTFAIAADLIELEPRSLRDVVSTRKGSVRSGTLQVPMILWGGDVATIYAADNGLFKAQGLDVSLYREDVFRNQVESCLQGKTPYLRGTMGMINAAAEVFQKNGLELVVIYQLTWSTGGDALVTRKNVKRPRDLKNETIQLKIAPTPKRKQFFSLATPFSISGNIRDINLGVAPGGLLGTSINFVVSPVTTPLSWVLGQKIPVDGSDICNLAIGAENRPEKSLPGCR